jgi:hypothetical protein
MTTTATNIQNRIDFLKNQLLINEIVRRIHEEWLAKFRLSGKITKRELNELRKRLEVQGFTVTFELRYDCQYCEIKLDGVLIDWFNLYYSNYSLENTIQTIDSQVKYMNTELAKLIFERNNVKQLVQIEADADALCQQIANQLQHFVGYGLTATFSSVTINSMPKTKLLMAILKQLK